MPIYNTEHVFINFRKLVELLGKESYLRLFAVHRGRCSSCWCVGGLYHQYKTVDSATDPHHE